MVSTQSTTPAPVTLTSDAADITPAHFTTGEYHLNVDTEIAEQLVRHAATGLTAVRAYAEATGLNGEDLATVIADLMADLRHLTNAADLNFNAVQDEGYSHYVAEIRGQL